MPKYSILIPYFDPEYKKTKLLTDCIKSVVENSKEYDYEIVLVKDGPSYGESHNIGFHNCKGDYIVVINDDITIHDSQWLERLTFDEGICSFDVVEHGNYSMPNAWCFLMSKEWYQKIGDFDEAYKDGINYEDTDYFLRAQKLGAKIKNADFVVKSEGSGTFNVYYSDHKTDLIVHNQEIFRKRWGNEYM